MPPYHSGTKRPLVDLSQTRPVWDWDCHRTAAPERPPSQPPLAVSRQSDMAVPDESCRVWVYLLTSTEQGSRRCCHDGAMRVPLTHVDLHDLPTHQGRSAEEETWCQHVVQHLSSDYSLVGVRVQSSPSKG